MTTSLARSVCPHDCPSVCALDVELIDGVRLGRVHGAKDDPYTAGVICEKVARYAERAHHPDRVLYPLRRVGPKGGGGWQRISWDDALSEITTRWLDIETTHGPEAIWPYFSAGTMGHVQRDGIHRLRHARGYSDQYDTICTGTAWPGYIAGTGVIAGLNPEDMAYSDCVVLWGTNAVATQVNVMTHATRARKTRGAPLVVIDIYDNATMAQADMPLLIRPGTDGALALGVMHVLLKEGLADRAYMAEFTDFSPEFEAHVKTRTPDWASAITGLPIERIEAFARLVGTTKNTFFRLGYGFTRQRNGATAMHAALSIPAMTGAWSVRGGGALHSNSGTFGLKKSLITGAKTKKVRALDMSEIGPVLTGDVKALQAGPPVMALFVQNTNPANVAPDQARVRQGLLRDDLFTVVHEQMMTDTARLADIVLPATMFTEHNDYYTRGGHTRVLFGPKLMEAPGEARSNLDLINALMARLGSVDAATGLTDREIVAETFRRSGVGDLDEIARTGFVDRARPEPETRFASGFAWPDGRYRFAPDWDGVANKRDYRFVAGPDLPRFADHWDVSEHTTPETPFKLATSPSRGFLNSSFAETPGSQKRQPQPEVLIHPDDAAPLGIATGDRLRLGNTRGEVVLAARLFAGLIPGTLIAEGIFPNRSHASGQGINALVSAEPVRPFGGVAFHDNAVWIRSDT